LGDLTKILKEVRFMVMNPKIIKVISAIEKNKEQIAELQARLKDLEKQKTALENDEIVAMFRREKLNEDEFAALLQAGRQSGQTAARVKPQAVTQTDPQATPPYRKEDGLDADN
jgi:DNA-binding transcriptional regulator YiaG